MDIRAKNIPRDELSTLKRQLGFTKTMRIRAADKYAAKDAELVARIERIEEEMEVIMAAQAAEARR